MLCLIHKLKSLTLQILPHGFGSAWAVASIHPRQIDLGFLPQIQTDLEFCRTPEVMNPLQCAQITLAPSHALISPLFFMPKYTQASQTEFLERPDRVSASHDPFELSIQMRKREIHLLNTGGVLQRALPSSSFLMIHNDVSLFRPPIQFVARPVSLSILIS